MGPTVAVKTGGAVVSAGLRDEARLTVVATCRVTVLSVLVEAALGRPAASTAAPAAIAATTVPPPLIPVTETV